MFCSGDRHHHQTQILRLTHCSWKFAQQQRPGPCSACYQVDRAFANTGMTRGGGLCVYST